MKVSERFDKIVYSDAYFIVYDGTHKCVDYNDLMRFYGDLAVKSIAINRKTGIVDIEV